MRVDFPVVCKRTSSLAGRARRAESFRLAFVFRSSFVLAVAPRHSSQSVGLSASVTEPLPKPCRMLRPLLRACGFRRMRARSIASGGGFRAGGPCVARVRPCGHSHPINGREPVDIVPAAGNPIAASPGPGLRRRAGPRSRHTSGRDRYSSISVSSRLSLRRSSSPISRL